MRPDGNTHLYQLNTEALQDISKEIFTPDKMASLVGDVEGEAWEHKVLKNYIEGDGAPRRPEGERNFSASSIRIKEIPASRKKRLVILKWLANQFEIGVNYPELQVNEI